MSEQAQNKKTPPRSIRIGEERTVRFEAFRAREHLTFSDAVHRLLDAGLTQEGFPPPGWEAAPKPQEAPPAKRRPAPKAEAPKATPAKPNGLTPHVEAEFGPPPSPPGSRLKQPPKAKERWKL